MQVHSTILLGFIISFYIQFHNNEKQASNSENLEGKNGYGSISFESPDPSKVDANNPEDGKKVINFIYYY